MDQNEHIGEAVSQGDDVLHANAKQIILRHGVYDESILADSEDARKQKEAGILADFFNQNKEENKNEELIPPIKLNGKAVQWQFANSRKFGNLLKARQYSNLGKLRPSLFQEKGSLCLVFLQTKGGIGKTSHAFNFAATAMVDGEELFLQSGVWETGRQTGLRPFIDLPACNEYSSRHLDLGHLRVLESGLQLIFAPERFSDSLTDEEFGKLAQILTKRLDLFTVDMGYFDIYNQDVIGNRLQALLAMSDAHIFIPWTGNAAAWEEASDLVRLLVNNGLNRNRLWGIEIFDGNNKQLYPAISDVEAIFDDQHIRIPYSPMILERAFYNHSLPILEDGKLREAYWQGLSMVLNTWNK